jgi:putative ABC transport system substrate-binding protein
MKRMLQHRYAPTLLVLCLMLTGLLLTACGGITPAKTYTIGVVNYVSALEPVLAGFKARLAESGYVEGKNVTYLYHGVLQPEPQVIAQEVQRLMDQKVDLFLTLGTQPTLAAKQAVAGTNIPVVFAPVRNPLKEGVVQSISHPEGNATGVKNGESLPKTLEWLRKIVPQATTVYVMYHPKDRVSRTVIEPLPAIASLLGIELVLDEVRSQEEARVAIASLPKDTAILVVPMPSLEPVGTLIEAAVQRGLAVGASYLQDGALFIYEADRFAMGQQAARLADQILKGTRPADLPVETAEYFLRINLKTATGIGLDIPDEILRQAHLVMR